MDRVAGVHQQASIQPEPEQVPSLGQRVKKRILKSKEALGQYVRRCRQRITTHNSSDERGADEIQPLAWRSTEDWLSDVTYADLDPEGHEPAPPQGDLRSPDERTEAEERRGRAGWIKKLLT